MNEAIFSGGIPFGSGIRDARLEDDQLLQTLKSYKRRIASSYRSLPPDRLGELDAAPMWVSRKVDGETWFLIKEAGRLFLANPAGRVLSGELPVLKQADRIPDASIIVGELHARITGRRERVGDLAAALAQEGEDAADAIGFVAFDGIKWAGNTMPIAHDEKLKILSSCISAGPHLQVVQSQVLQTGLEVFQRFESEVIQGGAEGLVIRHANGIIYKVKPEITLDAAVIAYTVKADQPRACRSILLGFCNPDGSFVLAGACGNLGSDEQRRAWFDRLQGLHADSQMRRASDGGGLYQFVEPKWVAEIKVTDLQVERSDGQSPIAQVCAFGAAGWTLLGTKPSPSLIHPVFQRIRDDKVADATGVRFDQIQEHLPGPRLSSDAASTALPASTLIRREVWTKTSKGKLAVRKLLVWKTNKSHLTDRFPEFVVHWTDFSAGRAEPLDREVRPAPDEASATQIANGWVEEHIKKGWEKAGNGHG